jgi:hypothetical protein
MNIDSMMFDNDDDVPMIILIVYSKFKVQKIWRNDIWMKHEQLWKAIANSLLAGAPPMAEY